MTRDRRSMLVVLALMCAACTSRQPVEPPAPTTEPTAVGSAKPVPPQASVTPAPAPAAATTGTVYEEPPLDVPAPAPALGAFEEAALPTSKYRLLMTVDEALHQRDGDVLGRVVMDGTSAASRCRGEPGMAAHVEKRRDEGAETYARCLSLGDWSAAKRLGLDYGSGVGHPPKSCGFGKHQVAHMFYALEETVVRVSVRAFTYGGRHAIILPVECSLPYTYDAAGNKVLLPVAEWMRMHPTQGASCPGLPWPVAWDLPKRCPVPGAL